MTKKILIDEAVVKQALEALESTGRFLHHCWCDVQMNEYSFDKLNKQMEIVDAEITALRGALEVNNKGVNALAEQPDYSICPACGGIASDPIVPVEARQQAAEPGRFVVVDRRTTPSGRHSHTVESDWPLPIGAILHTHPAHTQQPLTDEQIIKCWGQVEGTRHGYVSFARAIEAAHGITSKKGGAA